MPKVYDARTLLVGMMFDAGKLIEKDKVKLAFKLIKKKMKELENRDNADYCRVRWN